jgi:hypothetical protein
MDGLEFGAKMPLKKSINLAIVEAGNPNWRGRMSTTDLLVPTGSDQLLFILKLYISIRQTTYHNAEVKCTALH